MLCNHLRPIIRTSLLVFWTLSLGLVVDGRASTAAEKLPVVRLWSSTGQRSDSVFIITHGMGGTTDGDRFHQLADDILKALPGACRVFRVDWSERASAKIYGLPNPYKVAASIDEVGDQAAVLLQQEKIDPQSTIFIGESFGNWVNARIAQRLGGVHGILALNPANEGGGYPPPDLRLHARHSWSFHTYSVFDTTNEIAQNDFWLETPAGTSHWEQHIGGTKWLSARLQAGDQSWLQMDKLLPKRRSGHFQALVTVDGVLSELQLPRDRPAENKAPSISANSPTTDIAAAAH